MEEAKRTGRPSPDTEVKLKHADASDQKENVDGDSLLDLGKDKAGASPTPTPLQDGKT
jgi:hypothetical protein